MTASEGILMACLSAAVPMWMDHYRHWPESALREEADRLSDQVAIAGGGSDAAGPTSRADRVRNRGTAEKVGHAAMFNGVARSLGLGAHMPGGVTFSGVHWCFAWPHYGITLDGFCHQPVRTLQTVGGQL